MIINIGGYRLEGTMATRVSDSAWGGRASQAVTVAISHQEAAVLFADGAQWSVVNTANSDDGTAYEIERDMSEYAIAGPITDNRDGTVTVRMGRYSREELMRIPLADAPVSHSEAKRLRAIIEKAVQSIAGDEEALEAKSLYPKWKELAAGGAEASEGMRFRHNGGLYRVMTNHWFAENWVPGEGTESLYVRIDETHAGTQEDPIPYSGNMALLTGLYYSQDGMVYLCIRDTMNPVYNALSELTGLYVQAVSE